MYKRQVFARVSKKWVLPLSQRYNHADGSFAGIAYALIALDHFSSRFSTLSLGKGGTVTLRDNNLGIILRYPAQDGPAGEIGNRLVSPELQRHAQAGSRSATYHTSIPSDGVDRTISYRRLNNAPIYVLVGICLLYTSRCV